MTQTPSLNQENAGQGFPLVVMHGLFGDIDNFRSVLSSLEAHFEIIRLDLPGHGRSPTLPALTIPEMAYTVNAHLKSAGIANYHLLGHSLGGKVAMQMAGNAEHSAIEKLLIIDIAPRLYPPHHTTILNALQNVDLTGLNSRKDADLQLQKAIPNMGVRRFLLKSLYKNDNGEYGWRFDLEGIQASYDAIRQPPTFQKQIEAQTLFLKGGDSDYLDAQDEPAIRTHFQHPHFKAIAGTGHWLHAEKPDLFARICLDFLQQDAA